MSSKPEKPGDLAPGPGGSAAADPQRTTSIPGIASSGAPPPDVQRGAQPTFVPGEQLADRYRIVRFIARGGMGDVYEADDLELGGRVALKTVRPEIAEEEGMVGRFKREIHLARKVTHPNVCRIFDLGVHRTVGPAGEESRTTFLTMELLEGETLSQRLKKRGRLSLDDTLLIARQISEALGTAHEAGIIHRDFKSANVMLVPGARGERAVVTDFGLAHALAGSVGGETLTGTGRIVGTPAYMAPEQVEGGALGPAADIYALGIVIYEMVTGACPFGGDTPLSIAVKRLREKPPPPRSVVPDLHPRWEGAILRCLERDPRQRFESAADVARALAGEAVRPGRRTRIRLLAGVAAAIVLAGFGGHFASRSTRGPYGPETPAAISLRRSVAVVGFKNLGRPDAAWLSTALSEMLRTELAVGGQIRTIPGEDVARMKLELALAETDSLAEGTLKKIGVNLGADLVVLGSYLMLGAEVGGKLRLDLRLQDVSTGELVASAAEQGTEHDLFDVVSRAGAGLRQALSIDKVSDKEAAAVRAALPASAEGARLYSEGVGKLRAFDAVAACELLERAAVADPKHALIRSALAAAWASLGYDEKAKTESQLAISLAGELSREDRLAIEGLHYETTSQWEKAAEIYRSLSVFFPDSLDYGLRLAAAQTSAGKGQEALRTVESLRRLPPPAAADPRLDLAEAIAAKSLSDFERQRAAATRAADRARRQEAQLLYAQARFQEGTALVNLNRLEEAEQVCREAIRIFGAAGDKASVARVQNSVGVAHAMKGDLAGARSRFEAALRAFRETADHRGETAQLNNLGNIEAELGNPDRSRRLYEEARRVSLEIGDRSGVARALNNLGTLLEDTGSLEAARKSYEEAFRIFSEIGEAGSAARAARGVADVLGKRGQHAPAVQRYEQSVKLSLQAGVKIDAAETLVLLAKALADKDGLAAARQRMDEALALYRDEDDREGQAGALRALGDMLRRGGDTVEAQKADDLAAALEKGPPPR